MISITKIYRSFNRYGIADFVDYLIIPFEQVEYEVPIIMPEVLEQYIARHSPLGKPKGYRILHKTE